MFFWKKITFSHKYDKIKKKKYTRDGGIYEKNFLTNTTEVFAKTIFHYVPEILKDIDEINDPRKRYDYSMRYLIMSEILMFFSEGKSQRFTETAYKDNKYLKNIGKIKRRDKKSTRCRNIYKCIFKNRKRRNGKISI